MPKLNVGRSVQVESNLARRIAHERERRGQSYEGLAQLMTDAGCAIAGSSLYKIEKGSPPRRVSVDELWTLSKVWDLSIEDLLTPMDLIEQQRAHELIEELQRNQRNAFILSSDVFRVFLELARLLDGEQDLLDYVKGHFGANPLGLSPEDRGAWVMRLFSSLSSASPGVAQELAVVRVIAAAADFNAALYSAACLWAEADLGNLDSPEDQERLRAELEELDRRLSNDDEGE